MLLQFRRNEHWGYSGLETNLLYYQYYYLINFKLNGKIQD